MKQVLLLLLIVNSLSSFGQAGDPIKRSDELVANKKYDSAFRLLEKADPQNNNADIVLAKENIVLGYFVTSIMHQMFALKDLEPSEDIMNYRGKAGSYNMHVFRADSILTRLIKTQPNNYKLYNGLGNYYYEVFLHYNANWIQSAETLFQLIEENYNKSIALQGADYMVYYQLGYINELQKKYMKAIGYFSKSIELNSNYADAYYNLAYAYLYQDDRANALKYATKSIDLYIDKSYKADAARMTGEIYGELNDSKNALYYYELSDKIESQNYYTLKALLTIYVNTKDEKKKTTLNAFYSLAPGNPTIYNDLTTIFSATPKELINFYQSKLASYENDKKVYGSLNFYLAQLYIPNEKQKAKDCLIKAKIALSTVLQHDNAVFKAIDELMAQTK
ncbi:MAG: tetratricopeptide repeat protein [Sphingobacteriales bacterium]